MKNAYLYGVVLSLLLLPAFLYFFTTNTTNKEIEVIQYFPLDPSSRFVNAQTDLEFDSHADSDEYEVTWRMRSETEKPLYLRQDVSLLYVNGRLKGVLNKWSENTSEILKEATIHGEDAKKYEAISFHQGEIHEGKQPIRSIQALSHDVLYVIDSPHTKMTAFLEPVTPVEREWKERLDHSINQQVEAQWDNLLDYYHIPKDKYVLVPLTELASYEKKNLPGTATADSQRIMGQLWEGLYKNYILGIANEKSSHPIQSYIPIILFDKNGKHLLVLFEDDSGEKHQLIQYY